MFFLHVYSVTTRLSPVFPPVFPRVPLKKEQGCWHVVSGHVWGHIKSNPWTQGDKCLAHLLSFFFHNVRIGRFLKKLLLWSERHLWNLPLYLTKTVFSILFSFLSPIYLFLKKLFYTGIFIEIKANIIQGPRENVWAQRCYRGISLMDSLVFNSCIIGNSFQQHICLLTSKIFPWLMTRFPEVWE